MRYMQDELELADVAEAIDAAGFNVGALRVRQALKDLTTLRKLEAELRAECAQLQTVHNKYKTTAIGLLDTLDGHATACDSPEIHRAAFALRQIVDGVTPNVQIKGDCLS